MQTSRCNSVKPWTKNSFFIITLFIFFSRFVLSLKFSLIFYATTEIARCDTQKTQSNQNKLHVSISWVKNTLFLAPTHPHECNTFIIARPHAQPSREGLEGSQGRPRFDGKICTFFPGFIVAPSPKISIIILLINPTIIPGFLVLHSN